MFNGNCSMSIASLVTSTLIQGCVADAALLSIPEVDFEHQLGAVLIVAQIEFAHLHLLLAEDCPTQEKSTRLEREKICKEALRRSCRGFRSSLYEASTNSRDRVCYRRQ